MVLVIFAAMGAGADVLWAKFSAKVGSGIRPSSADSPSQNDTSPRLPQIIQQVLPSLVLVTTTTASGQDIGSGFVYDRSGDIATNAHVVQGSLGITVTTSNGRTFNARLIGKSVSKDVAAIRVAALSSVRPLTLGDSASVQLGEAVVAFGSPLGLQDTVTSGLISGMNRNFTIHAVHYHDMFQISAPIAQGNSGGPLIDQASRQVVGIDTAGAMQTAGNVGFAIPINQVKSLLAKWAKTPKASKPSSSAGSKQSAGQSIRVLDQFYRAINQKDYRAAYRLLGTNWQHQESYRQFVAGFQTTISDQVKKPVTNNLGNGETEVSCSLVAKTRAKASAKPVITVYRLNYLFGLEQGRLRILHGTAQVVRK